MSEEKTISYHDIKLEYHDPITVSFVVVNNEYGYNICSGSRKIKFCKREIKNFVRDMRERYYKHMDESGF